MTMREVGFAVLCLLSLLGRCPPLCHAQSDGSSTLESGEPLRVGLLASGNFPFSQPATGPTPENHAGLEGFEVGLAAWEGSGC